MILSMIGPGIVWAGLAIGGGELVLIPRVGSVYGMMFLWMPLLAIAIKYFMLNEIGRWSIVTGTSIFDGLAMIPGPRKWLSWILLFVSLYLGAVHIGGLVAMVGIIFHTIVQVFTPFTWSIVIMVSFVALSWTNRYSLLGKGAHRFRRPAHDQRGPDRLHLFSPVEGSGRSVRVPDPVRDPGLGGYQLQDLEDAHGGNPAGHGVCRLRRAQQPLVFRLGPFQGTWHGKIFRWA